MKRLIEKYLSNALDKLVKEDAYLLQIDINERSLSHRVATYLEIYFPEWNVDCEYNRNHDDIKRIGIKRCKVYSDDTQAYTVFPDVIVHKRGTNENLLAIEMKKTSSRETDCYDFAKLKAYKNQLGYQFTAFVRVGTGGEEGAYEIKWV